jgi:TonB-dependent receptor
MTLQLQPIQQIFRRMCLRTTILVFLLFGVLHAQTGNISGTVTEASGHAALVSAKVTVEGQELTTATGDSGRYLLLGVKPGAAKVTVSYLGMDALTQEVNVTAGATATLDLALSAERQHASVTVAADSDLVGQARALNDQKNSINLVNLVASDQIGSFPDPNAAEATQRIPGIVVQRDQGEGRYVLIRGTEPRLSATTINGERIGTTENTSRQIPLDTIPADLMGAIEITKVLTPEMEADSIGGRVNLITKRAPASRHLALTLGSGYNRLVNNDIKDYSGTYGQRLFHEKLGFIASANFYQTNRGSQDLEPVFTPSALTSLDLRDYELTRTRTGGVWDVDYKLGAGSGIYMRGLRTEYEDSELRHRLRDLVSNGRIERLLRNRYHDSNQTALMLGGTHTLPGSWLVTWHGSYSKAVLDTPYRLESTFRQTGATFAPNVNATSLDPANVQASPQNQNLNAFTFIQNAIQNDRGNERNISGGVDFAAPSRFGSHSGGLLKFGLRVRDENRTRDVASISQTPASGVRISLLDNINSDYKPGFDYLDGKYAEFGTAYPDPDKMISLSRGGSLVTVVSPTGDSGSYRAKERVTAGYVMDEIYLGERTTLLPGIRFESTNTTYSAPRYTLGAAGAVTSRNIVSGNSDYLNVLPGLHLRHQLFKDTPLRISFSRSLARPNYSDLAPFVLQDNTALTITQGNPQLKVTTSNNIDVSLEHYFQNVGIASAGFFYKNLGHYIYINTLTQTIGTDPYRVTIPVNGDSANLYGFEFTLVRQLDFLPAPMRGFAVYTNFTHVHSDATLPRGSFILPGQAANMGNASLGYERKGFSTRLSFNYQGHYVLAIGTTPADDNWLDNRLEIDYSASYRINKHAKVFLDVLNLGNEPYRVWIGDPNHAVQEERYKQWFVAGLKLDF